MQRWVKQYNLVVIGDREFRNTPLAVWLNKKKVDYILRLNKNPKIQPKYQKYQSLDSLKIKPGEGIIHQGTLVTEDNRKDRFNVVIYWKKRKAPQPWYLNGLYLRYFRLIIPILKNG